MGDKIVSAKDWSLKKIISEAWEKVDGFKGVFWGAIFLLLAIVIGMMVVRVLVIFLSALVLPGFLTIGLDFATMLVFMVLLQGFVAGRLMISISRAKGKSFTVSQLFEYLQFKLLMKLLLLMIVYFASVIVLVGIVGLCTVYPFQHSMTAMVIFQIFYFLTSIVFGMAMFLAFAQVVDQGKPVFSSYWHGFRLVLANFFKMVVAYLFTIAVVIAGALLLLVGLVWALPYIELMCAMIYRELCCPGESASVSIEVEENKPK